MVVVGKRKLPRPIVRRSLLSAAENSETTLMNIEIVKLEERVLPNIN